MPNSLTLLRRHRPACAARHPADSYSTEPEERRHGWKKCTCKIYAHGTLNGRFKKFATGARDWDRAREIVVPFLAAGRWDIDPPPPPPPPTPGAPGDVPIDVPRNSGVPIADAVKACLEEHQNCQSADNTIKEHRLALGLLARFSLDHGLRYIEQWDRGWMAKLRQQWGAKGNSQTTVRKKTKVLKVFFDPYVQDGKLPENPAAGFRIEHPNRAWRMREGTNSRQKHPYTDEELARMLAGCHTLRPRNSRRVEPCERRNCLQQWTGEDLADFIQISCFTGLRISDVATFHVSRLLPSGEVKVRCLKNGSWVLVWVPEWLRQTIRSRAQRFGPLIFGAHRTPSLNVITDGWRKKLNILWAGTGPWDSKPTPHRFRHTFIRILLERNVPVSLIADLTGDTEPMIRRHYSDWVAERQQNASRILREAFGDLPRFRQG